jgi:putative membrane protein insertion efficiency factor
LLGLIAIHRRLLSPLLTALTGSGCRFAPTCSEYARGALLRHGLLRGLGLTLHRLGRCHPLCAGGIDPVPGEVPRSKRRSDPWGKETA